MENKFKLKKFLATASAFAMITGASTAALGAQFKTDGNGAAAIEDGQAVVNAVTHPGGVGGNWGANDSFFFEHGNNLTINAGGNGGTVATIDINNVAGRTITIADDSSISSVINSTGVQTADLIVNDGKVLTLGGNNGLKADGNVQVAGTFTGLGNVTLGSGGGGSELVININSTLAGTINSDNAQDGVITVNAGKTAQFDGIIGATKKLDAIQLDGNASKATFNANVTADALNLNHATAEATIGDGVTLTGEVVATNAANEGVLIFAGSGVVTGDIGVNGGQELNLIRLDGDANSSVQLQGDIAATTTKIGAGKLRLDNGKTITGNVEALVGNAGTLEFDQDGTVTGTIGAVTTLGSVIANGAGNVDLQAAVKAQNLKVTNAGATVDLGDDFTGELQFSADGQATVAAGGKTITGDVKNTVAAGVGGTFANTGKLIFTAGSGAGAADGTVTGTIGEEGKALKLVQVLGAGDVSLSANAHHSEEFKFNNNDARLLVAAGGSLVGNLVANGAGNGKVQFAGAGEIKGTIGTGANAIGLIEANGGAAVKIGAGDHRAAFATKDGGASFEFADGANVTGTITNTSGAVNNTAVKFEGSSTVTGAVGGGANAIKTITVTGGSDKTVQFDAAVTATDLNIGQAGQAGAAKVRIGNDLDAAVSFLDDQEQKGELEIFGAGAHAVAGAINTTIGADEARGTITVAADVGANAVTLAGQIGDIANKKAVKLLHIKNTDAGGSVVLQRSDNVHIAKIQAAGAGNLKLNKADGKYKFGEVALDQDNVFSLTVNENAVLKAPTEGSVNIGGALKRLKALEFTADKTLTIENGVNIYAGELNATGVNNNGTLIFKGDSIFSAKSDGQNISAIEVQGDGKTVKLLKAIKTNNDIKLSNNATLEVAGNVTTDVAAVGAGHGIIGVGDGNGHLKFINSADVTVAGNVGGAGNRLQSIEFNGGNVRFTGDVTNTGKDFKFTGVNASVVEFDNAGGFGDANFVNASEANGVEHIVVTNDNEVFTGNIAIDNASTKQIAFDIGTNDKTATLQGAAQANGAKFINRGATGRGDVELNKADVTIYSAGTDAKKLNTIEFQENATITNGASANTTTINQNKTGTIGGVVSGTNFALANAGSTVKFLDGATLKVDITDTTGDKGIVEFLGGGAVEADNDIGTTAKRVKTVTFSDDAAKTLAFDASAYAAEKIDIRKATLKVVNNDVVLNAPDVNAANASFYLGSAGKITVNGGNLNFTGNEGKIMVGVDQAGDTISGGQIIAGTGTLEYGVNSAITVTPDDSNGSRPTGGASRTFTLIKNDTGKTATGTLLVNIDGSKNDFTKWTHSFDANGNLILTQIDGAADKIKELLGSNLDAVDTANIEALTQAENGTDAAKFVNEVLSKLTNDKAKLDEAINRLTSVTTVTDSIESSMASTVNGINTRLSLVGKQTAGTPVQSRTLASAKVSGVAAGDDHARYGAWFSPFFSKTTQKARKGAAGYKDTSYGGSFGMDTRANDDLIIGAAVTFANSEMKHKDFKSGDKTKVNSLMFSIYALQQITDTWFSQGSATIASNEVKNTENRSTATSLEQVNGKYNSMSFVGDVLFGYNYATEGFTLTPMGGVRYTRVNSAGYKENGSTTGQNLNVSQKASNKFEVVVGGRVSGGTFDVNGMSVTPELHGFISHDLIGKNPKQDLRIGGAPTSLTAKSRKPLKTEYNLGLGVNADYGMMEYGVGYDVHLAEKRVGHEGTLKVRVNF